VSPAKKSAGPRAAVPVVACLAAALGLGLWLRHNPPVQVEEAPSTPVLASSASATARASEPEKTPWVARTPDPEELHTEPLPPLPPGTTTRDLLETLAEDICACEDMECVKDANLRHNRYFGQAERVRDKVDVRPLTKRIAACLETIQKQG